MSNYDEHLLLFLALQTRLHGSLKTSTAKIAKHLGVSQQTASRKMRQLHLDGLIELRATPSGCTVKLTNQGSELLRQQFLSLQHIFSARQTPALQGTVKIGLGEGKYYVSRPFYLKQFKKMLGFKPFFGTLNLIVSQDRLASFLSGLSPIEIRGFKTEERSFGKIKAFNVLVQGKQKASLIFPERTAHQKNEVEVIAQVNLRKKFRLREGSRVLLKRP